MRALCAIVLLAACGRAEPGQVELRGGPDYTLAASGGRVIAEVGMLAVSEPCKLELKRVAKTVEFRVTGPRPATCSLRAEVTLDDGETVNAELPLQLQ